MYLRAIVRLEPNSIAPSLHCQLFFCLKLLFFFFFATQTKADSEAHLTCRLWGLHVWAGLVGSGMSLLLGLSVVNIRCIYTPFHIQNSTTNSNRKHFSHTVSYTGAEPNEAGNSRDSEQTVRPASTSAPACCRMSSSRPGAQATVSRA